MKDMELNSCTSCQKIKAQLNCGVCLQTVCKSCAHFGNEFDFSFLAIATENLCQEVYCGPCYDKHVLPELDKYSQTMEAAKNVRVFLKSQSKETRLLSHKESILTVTDCVDYNEAILRLAFFAAKAKFNAIIAVEITSRTVKNGSYQYSLWSGTARPTNITQKKLL
jgi:hypothetical protein